MNISPNNIETILDTGLLKAMEEGRKSEFVSRDSIMKILE